jgi:hypothetical protein
VEFLRWEWRKFSLIPPIHFRVCAASFVCVLRASSLLNVNYEKASRAKKEATFSTRRPAGAREETRRRLLLAGWRYSRIPMMLLLEFFTPRGES